MANKLHHYNYCTVDGQTKAGTSHGEGNTKSEDAKPGKKKIEAPAKDKQKSGAGAPNKRRKAFITLSYIVLAYTLYDNFTANDHQTPLLLRVVIDLMDSKSYDILICQMMWIRCRPLIIIIILIHARQCVETPSYNLFRISCARLSKDLSQICCRPTIKPQQIEISRVWALILRNISSCPDVFQLARLVGLYNKSKYSGVWPFSPSCSPTWSAGCRSTLSST